MAAAYSARCLPSPAGNFSIYPIRLIIFLLAAFPLTLPAQTFADQINPGLEEMISERYGPNQHLINGIEYVNLHLRSNGHKFLGEDKYNAGTIVLDNKRYHGVLLKYDIFNQHVLLLITHRSGGNKQIILNNLRINNFMIDDKTFYKYSFPGNGTRFYQVLGSNEMACFYHFRKEEISKPVDNNTLAEFTDEKKRCYLYRNGNLTEFRGNRSFIRIFPGHEPEVKVYLRQNRLRVRKLNDPQMIRLIRYCQSLTKSPDTVQ